MEFFLVHSIGKCLDGVAFFPFKDSCLHPLILTQIPINDRCHFAANSQIRFDRLSLDDRNIQESRILDTQRGVNALQKRAITFVKVAVLPGILVGAIPPEPVRTFRQVHKVLRLSQRLGGGAKRAILVLLQISAHTGEQIPGFSFFTFTNPGIVIGAEPGSRE